MNGWYSLHADQHRDAPRCKLPVSVPQSSCSRVQPIRVEVAPGQVEICQVYEMEDLLSVASTRIATMYHNNPVRSLSPGYCNAQNWSVRQLCALPPCITTTQYVLFPRAIAMHRSGQ